MPRKQRKMHTILQRARNSARGVGDTLRASPILSPLAMMEAMRGRETGLELTDTELSRRLHEALAWLIRAQDQGVDQGFARGYAFTWSRHFRRRGWQPSYPETTGYIIPTFFLASRLLGKPDLADRALNAAAWEIEIQLPSGAVQGGVIGEARSPSTFNTGQVLFGWLAAFLETGAEEYRAALQRAGDFLVSAQGSDGEWMSADSKYARHGSTLYNTRTAWALAEVGAKLGIDSYRDSAIRYLRTAERTQLPNGWLPRCCLSDPTRPLLHTLAYAYRGLVEAGHLLEEPSIFEAGRRGAEALAVTVADNGWMPGRYGEDWSPVVAWSCLTGQAQMANVWLRLEELLGEETWRDPAERALKFVASTQRIRGPSGVRGGIKGSHPVYGEYGRYQILNWATKFFTDGLLRLMIARKSESDTIPDHLRTLP